MWGTGVLGASDPVPEAFEAPRAPRHHLTPGTSHQTRWRAAASCSGFSPKSTKSLSVSSPRPPIHLCLGVLVLCGGAHLFSEHLPPPSRFGGAQPSSHYMAWNTETLILNRSGEDLA